MSNNNGRPPNKFAPSSPASAHQYPEDSFEAEELSRFLPRSPVAPHNYELTFKKDLQDQYFSRNAPGAVTRTLFASGEELLLDRLRLPLEEYHQMPLEELASLPFADLIGLELSELQREKLGLIGEILEVKRMRLKAGSVGVNVRCLRTKQALTHDEKHRLFLLELLWKQLSKKILLETLKLNLAQRRYIRAFGQMEREMQRESQWEESSRIRQQFLQEEEPRDEDYPQENSRLWQEPHEEDQQGSDSENLQEKLMIFSHSILPIFKKQLFFAFNRISQAGLHTHPHQNLAKTALEQQYESIPLISRPNITDESQFSRSNHHELERTEQQASESKLEQLCNYIEDLHEECAHTDSLLKRYFIKMKINLLDSIAQSLIRKFQTHSLSPRHNPQRDERRYHYEEQPIREEEQEEEDGRESRYTSELSQDGSLKAEKRILKDFIKDSRRKTFFVRLKGYCEARNISSIAAEMYKGSVLSRAFRGLLENAKEQQFERQMSGYYSEMAEQQYEDDGSSIFFHKTNLLYRYFHQIKENHRNQRMFRALDSTTLKLVFRTLKSHLFHEQRQREIVDRYLSKAQSRRLFKYFSSWKQVYLSENCLSERFRLYMVRKERETLQHHFSVLKLHFKKGLLRERRAEQLHELKLRRNAFVAWKYVQLESRELGDRSAALHDYLWFTRADSFMLKFRQFYLDYTSYQRFTIKEEKLRRTLIRLHALQAVKQWRKRQLRKQAYQAIEMKLARFKNKQTKREIMTRWMERTQEQLERSGGSASEQHKDWLVKYYGDLCSVLP